MCVCQVVGMVKSCRLQVSSSGRVQTCRKKGRLVGGVCRLREKRLARRLHWQERRCASACAGTWDFRRRVPCIARSV